MKKSSILKFALVGAAAALPVWLIAPGRPTKEQRAQFTGWNYAHRGLHSEDKTIPENSLRAFRLAAENGYGIELDVHLSKDGQVFVFHDDTLNRVCGVEGRVEDLSYEELSRLSLHGTEETIPLFSDVLNAIDGCGPLIVEIKAGKRNNELCEKTYELLRGYKGVYCIESFHPAVVRWFKKHAPEVVRGQLATRPSRYGKALNRFLAFTMGNGLSNFATRPHFIAYEVVDRPFTVRLAKLMGAMNIGWTSHTRDNEKSRDGVIFEFYRPEKKYK